MDTFNIEITIDESDEFIYCIKVIGELRRGRFLSGATWKHYTSNARTIAKTKRVIFDLSKMTYWDTGGMLEIVSAVVDINKTYVKRAGIVKPADPHLLVLANLIDFARRKYNDSSISQNDIPMADSKASLLELLES